VDSSALPYAGALLAGGTLAAFTHLSTLRLKPIERSIDSKDTEQADRDMVDEVAIHLIMASTVIYYHGTVADSLTCQAGTVPGAHSKSD
jgi:putative hemolysin